MHSKPLSVLALATALITPALAFQAGATSSVQTGRQVTSAGTQTSSVSPAAKRTKRRRRPATQVIPVETYTPPTQANAQLQAAKAAQQRAADQRLLQQQQAQSDKAAQINNQQVQQAIQQKNQVQNEVRVQDAPGPAQTGVVPGAGQPFQPPPSTERIQDAPGPVQTQPVQAQPSQTQPSTSPNLNSAPPQA